MKKRIIIAAVFTACLALYAAVWPQAETVGETPELPQTPAVSATAVRIFASSASACSPQLVRAAS